MIHFTSQEKSILVSVALILFFGSTLNYAFKEYPQLYDLVNLAEADRLISKVDVNKATADELEAIPYIGAYTAIKIIQYREDHNGFKSLKELMKVKGIREKNFERFKSHLEVRKK